MQRPADYPESSSGRCRPSYLPASATWLGAPEEAVAKAREALVFELLRQCQNGHSCAAQLLGITRETVLDLMARLSLN